jgi:hypothetical protein
MSEDWVSVAHEHNVPGEQQGQSKSKHNIINTKLALEISTIRKETLHEIRV